MLRIFYVAIVMILLLCNPSSHVYAQESASLDKVFNFSDRLIRHAKLKTDKLSANIDRQMRKQLQAFERSEARMKKKLAVIDSAGTARVSGEGASTYDSLYRQTKNIEHLSSEQRVYIPYLDSLKGSLSFLQQHADRLSPAQKKQLDASLGSVRQLEDKLTQSMQIKTLIKERRQQIASFLTENPALAKSVAKEFDSYRKQYYYYSQQLHDYKEMWKDPARCEKKALSLLNQVPTFHHFMKEHSMLASLFRLPADYGTAASLDGLQTRDAIQQRIQAFASAGGPAASQMMEQNLQSAKGQLKNIKDKLSNIGGGDDTDADMPDFKPNSQKTKTFLQRLEYGTNFQTARSSTYFPTTADVGISIGYKLNDKNIVGVGVSYKFGLGTNISHIFFSNQGVGLRSFIDYKLKGSFFVSGGVEYNYQQHFHRLAHIEDLSKWQQSGLLGISKIVSLKTKFCKKTTVQLFWDFLSYYQAPKTQPLKFRVGYKF